jgi:60 kDa SS-A/Ro ribonucleoprotein
MLHSNPCATNYYACGSGPKGLNMSNALRNVKTREVAQTERTPGRDEIQNAAGGFVFKVTDKTRLERFLILGTDKGTFYASEKDLTSQNFDFIVKQAQTNVRGLVDTIVEVRTQNRAAKQSPAIFALAVALVYGDDKAYVRQAVNTVLKTGTQLFEFAQYIENLGGWGRAKRAAIADWYESKSADALAYQAIKYRQRNGWTHRDAFRLSHPKGVDTLVGDFILGKNDHDFSTDSNRVLEGFKVMQAAKNVNDVLNALENYDNLPWETIPTEFLKDARVWKKLFYAGALGQTALLRNVTRFSKIGAFDDIQFAGDVAKRLADKAEIAKGRMHPVAYLNALGVYTNGRITSHEGWGGYGGCRQKDWTTNAKVAGALETGFYNAFGNVKPANKRTMVSIDVSGSMTWWGPAGLVGLDCREAAAAMAMVLVRTEPYVTVNAFSTDLRDAGISDTDNLATVQSKISRLPMGGTDCAQPMVHATAKNLEIDTFTVWTDNETWAGRVKPVDALRKYRQKSGIDAKLVVVGMTSTEASIADPSDKGMLDVVGFDSNAPGVIAEFSAGRL